ncbi:MAG TPA: terminase small subunit [Chitinophagaceae bacterium]|jgi:hypothetical protein|nr:terminase small subunit [Chitinophagaceae bacterium]
MPYRLQPAQVQAKFEEYRKQCDENIETVRYRDKLVQVPRKIIYTLEGFCLFLDIGEEELAKYEDNKNYRAIFKKIRFVVMCRKMHALVNGESNTRALIYDLKVNHGIDAKQARQDEDWKITLNLNEGEPPVVIKSPGWVEDDTWNSEEGVPGNMEDCGPESGDEAGTPGSTGTVKAGSQHEDGTADGGAENRKHENTGAGTKEPAAPPPPAPPPKTNPYSIW